MGRFYKTASPQMVDFMYKIPEQAILKAIEGTDKQIDTEYLYKTETEKLLQKKALSPDEARQKEKLAGYQKEIDEVSQLLSTSPLAALKDKQRIRDLQSKIYQDVTRGEIAAQYQNYDIRQKHLAEETQKATNKDGSIRQEDLDAAMKAFDDAFARGEVDEQGVVKRPGGTAYDLKTGAYRSYSPEKLVNYFDITAEAKSQAEGWEPDVNMDVTKQYLDRSGNYIITDKQGKVELKKDDLSFGLYNIITSNPEVLNYKDQQIRIRSGAKPGTEAYLKEWEKVYGVRKERGNLGSPFAMESIMQTVTDPETGKTETKPLTRQVQKYDKEGNPEMKDGKPVMEEKEIKRVINAGEIFRIAEAQAERKDQNKIVSSITQDETKAYEVALQADKEIRVGKALKDYEDEKKTLSEITFSNNNAQAKVMINPYSTHEEFHEGYQKLEKDANSLVDAKGTELSKLLARATKNGEITAAKESQLQTQLQSLIANKDFKGLQNFIQSNNIVGIKDVGTGIKELETNYKQIMLDVENQKEHYKIIRNSSKPKGYDAAERALKEKQLELDKAYADDNKSEINRLQKQVNEQSEQMKLLNGQWGKTFNENLDINNKNGMNVNVRTIFSTGGDELRNIVPNEVLVGFSKSLKGITGSELFPHLRDGSQAVLIKKGETQATNFNQLIDDLNINYEDIKKVKDGEEITLDGGKKVTFKLGSTRINPGSLTTPVKSDDGKIRNKALGKNTYQVTMELYEPKKGMQTYEVYIPFNEITNEALRKGAEALEPYHTPIDVKDNVKAAYGALKNKMDSADKSNYYQRTIEGHRYYPEDDRWEFKDGKKLEGDAGIKYYQEYLLNNR
jgi:hypothetical protein